VSISPDFGCVKTDSWRSLTSSTFSEDSTLLATGFSDSSIKLWNLKGDKFRPMKTGIDPDKIESSELPHTSNDSS